jgi:hypothetical protein
VISQLSHRLSLEWVEVKSLTDKCGKMRRVDLLTSINFVLDKRCSHAILFKVIAIEAILK